MQNDAVLPPALQNVSKSLTATLKSCQGNPDFECVRTRIEICTKYVILLNQSGSPNVVVLLLYPIDGSI